MFRWSEINCYTTKSEQECIAAFEKKVDIFLNSCLRTKNLLKDIPKFIEINTHTAGKYFIANWEKKALAS